MSETENQHLTLKENWRSSLKFYKLNKKIENQKHIENFSERFSHCRRRSTLSNRYTAYDQNQKHDIVGKPAFFYP